MRALGAWVRGGGGVRTFIFFIALFCVLKHSNHFKAIKKYLITGLGSQPPLRRPPALTSAKSPSLTFFFFEAFPKGILSFLHPIYHKTLQ